MAPRRSSAARRLNERASDSVARTRARGPDVRRPLCPIRSRCGPYEVNRLGQSPEPSSRRRRRTTAARRAQPPPLREAHHRAEVALHDPHGPPRAPPRARRPSARRRGSRAARSATSAIVGVTSSVCASAPLTRPGVLPGPLHDHRHGAELVDVREAHAAARVHAHLPREAVVGRHDDQRVVVDALALQPRDQRGPAAGRRSRAGAAGAARCGGGGSRRRSPGSSACPAGARGRAAATCRPSGR